MDDLVIPNGLGYFVGSICGHLVGSGALLYVHIGVPNATVSHILEAFSTYVYEKSRFSTVAVSRWSSLPEKASTATSYMKKLACSVWKTPSASGNGKYSCVGHTGLIIVQPLKSFFRVVRVQSSSALPLNGFRDIFKWFCSDHLDHKKGCNRRGKRPSKLWGLFTLS